MKVRLNFFVLVTALFGYLLARKGMPMEWATLFHTLIGTAAAAFGSAAFNQLMEIDLDAVMKRTADRPLPSRRMNPVTARNNTISFLPVTNPTTPTIPLILRRR